MSFHFIDRWKDSQHNKGELTTAFTCAVQFADPCFQVLLCVFHMFRRYSYISSSWVYLYVPAYVIYVRSNPYNKIQESHIKPLVQ